MSLTIFGALHWNSLIVQPDLWNWFFLSPFQKAIMMHLALGVEVSGS